MNQQTNDLFEDDFCEGCNKRVRADTMEENNEHWYCQECLKEWERESEEAYELWVKEQLAEEAREKARDDAVEEHYRKRYLPS